MRPPAQGHALASQVASYRPELDGPSPGRPVLALVALDIHDAYTALEVLFERVARAIDGDVPSGVDSHRALLDQMATEIPGVRAAVLGASSGRSGRRRVATVVVTTAHARPE